MSNLDTRLKNLEMRQPTQRKEQGRQTIVDQLVFHHRLQKYIPLPADFQETVNSLSDEDRANFENRLREIRIQDERLAVMTAEERMRESEREYEEKLAEYRKSGGIPPINYPAIRRAVAKNTRRQQ